MTAILHCVIGEGKMGCSFLDINNHKCDVKHDLKYLLFRDPNTRQHQEIELCTHHFGETVQEPLILPVEKLRRKLDNLMARNNRERQIAKKNEVPFNYKERQGQVDHVRKAIQRQLSFKCSNVICGTSLSTLNPLYSMMVISGLGKVSYKFYFCTKACWDKMRIRTGVLKPIINKSVPLTEFFKGNPAEGMTEVTMKPQEGYDPIPKLGDL
jgi:hypothetical protein